VVAGGTGLPSSAACARVLGLGPALVLGTRAGGQFGVGHLTSLPGSRV
jgi:hypothetical protein